MTQLSSELEPPEVEESKLPDRIELATDVFLRCVAMLFLGLALAIWLRAVGFWEADGVRFDTMSASAQTYTAMLAVLFPVTAVGLWTTLSWGRVVWFLSVIVQLLAFAGVFGSVTVNNELLITQGICVIIYLSLRGALRFIPKKD